MGSSRLIPLCPITNPAEAIASPDNKLRIVFIFTDLASMSLNNQELAKSTSIPIRGATHRLDNNVDAKQSPADRAPNSNVKSA
jgi:hypothetical protein